MASTREIQLELQDGLRFVATTADGHRVLLDSRLEAGAPTEAPSPTQMLVVALGGCAAMDVISILRKMRHDVAAYEVRISGERADEHPKAFTAVRMHHQIRGTHLAEHQVVRAIQLSMGRYCPVIASLDPRIGLASTYELQDARGTRTAIGEVDLAALDDPDAG